MAFICISAVVSSGRVARAATVRKEMRSIDSKEKFLDIDVFTNFTSAYFAAKCHVVKSSQMQWQNSKTLHENRASAALI